MTDQKQTKDALSLGRQLVRGFIESLPLPVGGFIESLPLPVGGFIESLPLPVGGFIESLPLPVGGFIESLPIPVEGFIKSFQKTVYNSTISGHFLANSHSPHIAFVNTIQRLKSRSN